MTLYTCKCCWFKTLDSIWQYDICNICDWEDDYYQSENINSAWGANKISLSNCQSKILKNIPIEIKEMNWYIRDKEWKPLVKIKESKTSL